MKHHQQQRFRLEVVVRVLFWGARGLPLLALLPTWQGRSLLTAFGVLVAAMPLRRTRRRKPQLALCWVAPALCARWRSILSSASRKPGSIWKCDRPDKLDDRSCSSMDPVVVPVVRDAPLA